MPDNDAINLNVDSFLTQDALSIQYVLTMSELRDLVSSISLRALEKVVFSNVSESVLASVDEAHGQLEELRKESTEIVVHVKSVIDRIPEIAQQTNQEEAKLRIDVVHFLSYVLLHLRHVNYDKTEEVREALQACILVYAKEGGRFIHIFLLLFARATIAGKKYEESLMSLLQLEATNELLVYVYDSAYRLKIHIDPDLDLENEANMQELLKQSKVAASNLYALWRAVSGLWTEDKSMNIDVSILKRKREMATESLVESTLSLVDLASGSANVTGRVSTENTTKYSLLSFTFHSLVLIWVADLILPLLRSMPESHVTKKTTSLMVKLESSSPSDTLMNLLSTPIQTSSQLAVSAILFGEFGRPRS